MREIKFRVLIDREMYYQDKYEAYGDNLSSIDICKETITITSFYNYEDVYRFEDEEVKLMQYTGLNDKNNKEIYEGDILLSSNENGIFLQLIGFGNDDREYSGILNGFKIIDGRLLENDDYEIDECKEFTQELIKAHNIPILQPENTIIDGWWVIGNIYENKNLLEENKWNI